MGGILNSATLPLALPACDANPRYEQALEYDGEAVPILRNGDWQLTQGASAVGRTRSSKFAERLFCGKCGTPLAIDYDIQPETFDFSVATLDDPAVIEPSFHIFWASRVRWFDPGDDLPRFDQFRPNTVGLEGTAPPA